MPRYSRNLLERSPNAECNISSQDVEKTMQDCCISLFKVLIHFSPSLSLLQVVQREDDVRGGVLQRVRVRRPAPPRGPVLRPRRLLPLHARGQ